MGGTDRGRQPTSIPVHSDVADALHALKERSETWNEFFRRHFDLEESPDDASQTATPDQ